jgi:hypothetical protein
MLDADGLVRGKTIQAGASPATNSKEGNGGKCMLAPAAKKDDVGFVGFIYFFLILCFKSDDEQLFVKQGT